MVKYLFLLIFNVIILNLQDVGGKSVVPVLSMNNKAKETTNTTTSGLKYLPFIMLIDQDKDTSEFWRETEILSLVRSREQDIDYEKCEKTSPELNIIQLASRRTVKPICRNRIELTYKRSEYQCDCNRFRPDLFIYKNRMFAHKHRCPCYKRRLQRKSLRRRMNLVYGREPGFIGSDYNYQLCPQCPHFNNHTECELFRDSCKERKVHHSEYKTYCDRKYGKWRTMFVPADYSQCRCCDECISYRELDQSCVHDEYNFDTEEFLPVTSIDFRAGCNPYWGHPEQELRGLRCDKILRRCVPVTVPQLPHETLSIRRNFRYEPPTGGEDCPATCRGFECPGGLVSEQNCKPGAFIPDNKQCNCCGKCSAFQQLNQKCAEFKKTIHQVNGTVEIEVEEEFLEPGCDDGLVCRQGSCQDIHTVRASAGTRKKRDEGLDDANEPCKSEVKFFKKKYGPDGHLHFNAPQCTPLWLYAPVQCRRFVCYCALEDGSFIQGIRVPRVEVSNMNCDCAREKCRTGSDVECDGYGNYKEAIFTSHGEHVGSAPKMEETTEHSVNMDLTTHSKSSKNVKG